jgi:hypothetical protein
MIPKWEDSFKCDGETRLISNAVRCLVASELSLGIHLYTHKSKSKMSKRNSTHYSGDAVSVEKYLFIGVNID